MKYIYTDSDYRKCIMKIWNNRILRPPTTTMAVTTTSLGKYIQNNPVTPRDIIAITVQLTCGIRMLHE